MVFDANLLMDGFATPSFKSGPTWVPAVGTNYKPNPLVPILGRMSPHVFTPTRIVSENRALKITKTSTGSFVFWFPSNEASESQLKSRLLAPF